MAGIIDKAKPADDLADQILAKWGRYGDWKQGGIDRAGELAGILRSRGVTDLSKLAFEEQSWDAPGQINAGDAGDGSYSTATTQKGIGATYAGKRLGYLGDSDRGGKIKAGSGAEDEPSWRGDQRAIAWSAQGGGNVSFVPVKAPDGSFVMRPVWGSSKKETFDDIRGAASIAALAAGAYYAGAGGTTGAIAQGSLQGQGMATGMSALSGKGDVQSMIKAGLGGAATGAIGGGMKSFGAGQGWSPAATKAATSSLLTAARGGSIRDIGTSALLSSIPSTGSGIIDGAITAGASTAIKGGSPRQAFLSAALSAGSRAAGGFFKKGP